MSEAVEGGRIVVGVDGSDPSENALREGARLAEHLGASLEAVMCWEDPVLYENYRAGDDPEDFRQGGRELLETALTDVFGDRRPANLTTRLVRGQAASRLLEESEGATLLVVGRRGSGGVLGLVLGSVSSALVAHAKCPVLVVRH